MLPLEKQDNIPKPKNKPKKPCKEIGKHPSNAYISYKRLHDSLARCHRLCAVLITECSHNAG